MIEFRVLIVLLAVSASSAYASGVTVRFSPTSPDVGPFPADALTIEDTRQKTGRRINLPLPDCAVQSSACAQTNLLNEYDGFSLNPRLLVRFSAPVDTDSLRRGVFLVALDNMTSEEPGTSYAGTPIPLNKLIWDPVSFSLFAKPDNVLDQHRRYALIITSAVRDTKGEPVEADPAFLQCLNRPDSAFCGELASRLSPLFALGEWLGGAQRIVSASVFTTMSVTAWLEKARDLLPLTPLAVRPTGTRSVFPAADIAQFVFRQHTTVSPVGFTNAALNVSRLSELRSLSFGSYQSPNYLTEREIPLWGPNRFQTIATVPSALPMEPPAKTEEVFYVAALPSTPKPSAGFPVVILIHGGPGVKTNFIVNGLSQTMAAAGYATIAISAAGNGFGPESRLAITERNGTVTEFTAGGRTNDIDRNGTIVNGESCALPHTDCIRQTVVDLMQLVRVIQAGLDLDGDGSNDLDARDINVFGSSYGAYIGTLLTVLDPAVSSATLSVGGGTILDARRWSPVNRADLNNAVFGNRTPRIEPNQGTLWEDENVLRDQPVKVVTRPGAIRLHDVYETVDWLMSMGDPLMYAAHFRSSTLPGVPIKRVMFIMCRGDQQVVNPTNSAWIRAANMSEWSVLYRHDLARAAFPALPANGHAYINPGAVPASATVALSAQRMAALFFATGSRCPLDQPCIPDVNELVVPVFGKNLFEIPQTLPEDLGFLQ